MKKILLTLVSPIFLFVSCTTENTLLPRFTGSAGEMVVIAETYIWENALGDSIRDFFEQATPHLPQPEAKYYLAQYEPSGFNNLLRQHRNVLMIDVDQKNPKNEVNLIRSKWSSEQVVVQIRALSTAEAITLFNERKSAIMELFDKAECERLQSKYQGNTNKEVAKMLAATFGLKMQLPNDMLTAVGTSDRAVWLKRDRVKYLSGVGHDISQGLVIYDFPYESDSTFTNEFATMARNKAVSVVSSDGKNKYMTTELEYYPPVGQLISLNQKTAWYSSGLWIMENDFMGGPFVNLLILDEKNQRVIGIDGYVFAPKFNKREYVREMEAMLKSIKLFEK